MASLVYFKFKANVKTDSIPFDGSAISVKDLKNAIKTKCCMYSADIDLKLEDSSGKEFTKDNELIPKYTSIVVRRVPKLNNENQKRRSNQQSNIPGRDSCNGAQKSDGVHSSMTNLADSDLTEEEKIRVMIAQSSEIYDEINCIVKAKPYGNPPQGYICHKCNLSGHWIYNCPGIRDQTGKLIDSKSIKRPTGIPQTFLLEVDADTPGAYLAKSGRYMVPTKDAEAYSKKKKDRRAFSVEENPPYIPPQEVLPPREYICPLCNQLLRDAVLVSCCGKTYCNECIIGLLFDSDASGSRNCPNCGKFVGEHETTIIENGLVRSMVHAWTRTNALTETSNYTASPEVAQTKNNSPEPEKVVRRLLKPKQPALADVIKQDIGSTGQQDKNTTSSMLKFPNSELYPKMKNETSPKPEMLCEPSRSKTLPFPSKSESSVNNVKNYSLDSSTLPIISNTCNSVANMPCATLFGATGTPMVSTAPIASSNFAFYNSAPLVLSNVIGDDSSSLVNAMYRANIAGMVTSGTSQSQLANVFQGTSLGSVWPSGDVSYFNGVDQNALLNPNGVFPSASDLSNPLFDIHDRSGDPAIRGEKFLSKEEFYRLKMKLIKQSSYRRSRRSRSRDSLRQRDSHRRQNTRDRARGVREERLERRREDRYQSSSRKSPPSTSTSRHYTSRGGRSRSQSPQPDYDTWRLKKERRQLIEKETSRSRHRQRLPVSPLHSTHYGPRQSHPEIDVIFESPKPISVSEKCSPEPLTRNQASPNSKTNDDCPTDKSEVKQRVLYINPERSNRSSSPSPLAQSTRAYSGFDSASSRGPTPPEKSMRRISPYNDIKDKALSKKSRRSSKNSYTQSPTEAHQYEEINAKALKKLKKEKRRRHKEKKRAKRALRALREGEGYTYDNVDGHSPAIIVDDALDMENKHKRRKVKKQHNEADVSEPGHKKRKKSKKSMCSPDESVDIC